MEEVEDGAGVRGQYGLLHELAFPVQHGSGDGALVDIEADILDAVHQGVPFVRLGLLLRTAAIDYSKGAPFYNACPHWRRRECAGSRTNGKCRRKWMIRIRPSPIL